MVFFTEAEHEGFFLSSWFMTFLLLYYYYYTAINFLKEQKAEFPFPKIIFTIITGFDWRQIWKMKNAALITLLLQLGGWCNQPWSFEVDYCYTALTMTKILVFEHPPVSPDLAL